MVLTRKNIAAKVAGIMELEKLIRISENEYEIFTFNMLYEKYKPLLISEANKYRSVIEFEDALQIAGMGLLKGFRAYDINRNTQFITVATTYIRNELRAYYRQIKNLMSTMSKFNDNIDKEEILEKILISEDIQDRIIEMESARQTLADIYQIMDTHFTDRQKQIFELYILKDNKLEDVAKLLNCNVSYVTKETKICKEKIQRHL
jgi:RNA polymerase sigma factor (sigma-70 family)